MGHGGHGGRVMGLFPSAPVSSPSEVAGTGPDMIRHVRGGRLHFSDILFLARKFMSTFPWLNQDIYHRLQLSFLLCTYAGTHFIFST